MSSKLKKKRSNFVAFNSLWTSSGVGRAEIAPFLVVLMAPYAFANLNISLNFDSSLK